MKQIYILAAMLFGWAAHSSAQTPCDAGRYSTELFPNVTVTSGVQFGNNLTFTNANMDLFMDIYEPTGDTETARPLIIWAHGGSFIGGSRTDSDVVTLSDAFAKRGFVCASIDYRVGMWPIDSVNAVKAVVRAVQDMKGAMRFFYEDRATTDTYKIDTTRIIVAGSSAGAVTALHLAYLDQDCEVEPYINAATLASMGGLEGTSGSPGYSSTPHAVVSLAGALASYGWLEAGDIPFCTLHGDNDGTVPYNTGIASVSGFNVIRMDGSRVLNERAVQQGVQNKFYTHYDTDHAPYAVSAAFMDTTITFVSDFLVDFMGCSEPVALAPNTPTGTADLYQLFYCGLGINEQQDAISNLYPNPSNDVMYLELKDAASVRSVEVIDLTGRVLQTLEPSELTLTISKNELGAGTYFVRVTSTNGHTSGSTIIFN